MTSVRQAPVHRIEPCKSTRFNVNSPSVKDREWIPKFWDGICLGGWLRLLRKNRFRVTWRRWHLALLITLLAVFHSIWRRWQWLLVGWRAGRQQLHEAPIFIIGHWRSGTTLLHELLVLDARHTFPNTYQCFAPNHFLISERFAQKFLGFLLPKHRPMDKMPAGWDRPQEDEFALCNLGVPSPYLTIAFPNEPPADEDYLTLEDVSDTARKRWQDALFGFLRHISYRDHRRIVLKSPPHTGRIALLREMFPDARFVHIVRDPYVVFASTVNLWKRLYATQGLQVPTFRGLDEYVLTTFERMYAAFETQRRLVSPNRLTEVRYEDLVADPVETIRRVYEALELGDSGQVLDEVERYFASVRNYQTNRYELSPDCRDLVTQRWSFFFHRYGYQAAQVDEPVPQEAEA